MIEGTVSTVLTRVSMGALAAAGTSVARFAALPGLDADTLADDLVRVPTSSGLAVWEQLVVAARDTCLTERLLEQFPAGSMGVWDHLFTSGPTFFDGARDAGRYFPVIGDPGMDSLRVLENGSLVTLQFATGQAEPDVCAAIQEFALALFLQRAREATRKPVAPVRVAFAHEAPRHLGYLVDLLGTRNVEFGAAANTITLLAGDAIAPLPGYRPGLSEVLCRHADLTLTAARPAMQWHDKVRAAILAECGVDAPTIEATARRLALSSRTLQRRLHAIGTTFRQEVESVREERAMRLFQETDLSLQSIAAKVGYSDARTLRRAVHRWHGQTPTAVRRMPPP